MSISVVGLVAWLVCGTGSALIAVGAISLWRDEPHERATSIGLFCYALVVATVGLAFMQ